MPNSLNLFNSLPQAPSTNNYAIEALKKGAVRHGTTYFTTVQTAGKGQFDKKWESEPHKNIALSIVFIPKEQPSVSPVMLSHIVSSALHKFVKKYVPTKVFIKWPNDIYINDKKAAGILIENHFANKRWLWSVIGIGINVNQLQFENKNATSLLLESNSAEFDVVALAQTLHGQILTAFRQPNPEAVYTEAINSNLYKKNEWVKIKPMQQDSSEIISKIIGVNKNGYLVTEDSQRRTFASGSIQFNF